MGDSVSTPFAHEGKMIAGRFELTNLAANQPESADARAWIARDTARSLQLRAIVLDPEADRVKAAIDAARRTAFITGDSDNDPSAVSIISVVSDGDDHAIFTEIPPGTPLSSFLHGEQLDPELVQSIMGEVASAVNSVRHHGIRHLQLTPSDIYLTDSCNVVIDGYGIKAALAGIDTTRTTAELDRDEARRLTVLLANLLLGNNVTSEQSDDEALNALEEARWIHGLPESLDELLRQEIDGEGAISPDSLMLRLVPWGDLDMNRLPAPRTQERDDEHVDDGSEPVDVVATQFENEADAEVSAVSAESAPEHDQQDVAAEESDDGHSDGATGAIAAATALGGVGAATGLVAHTATSKDDARNVVEKLLGLDSSDSSAPRAQWPKMPEPETAPDVDASDDVATDDATGEDVTADEVVAANVAAHEPATSTDQVVPERADDTPADELDTDDADVNETRELAVTDAETTTIDSADSDAPARAGFAAATAGGFKSSSVSSPDFNAILAGEEPATTPSSATTTRSTGAGPTSAAASKGSWARTEVVDTDEPTVNATVISIVLLALVVLAGAFLGLRGLFQPFDDVTLSDPDANVTTQVDEPAEETQTEATPTEEPSDEPTVAPVVSNVNIVNPDASVFGYTEATQHDPQLLPRIIDGDPNTVWKSWWFNHANMAPSSGFGIHVVLEEEATVSDVVIDYIGQGGGNIQLRDTVVAAPSTGILLAEASASAETHLIPEEPVKLTEFIIWFTEMPTANNGRFEIEISDIHVN